MSYESKKNAPLLSHLGVFFHKTQSAWQGVKLIQLMSIFIFQLKKSLGIFDKKSSDTI